MFTTLIDAEALSGLLAGPGAVLLDCRAVLGELGAGLRAFEGGHIPGAVHLDLESDLSGPPNGRNGRHPLPDRAKAAAAFAAAGLSAGQQAIAYDDQGGAYAGRCWWLLRWLGHDAVAVLDGGIQAWEAAGFALETGPACPRAPGSFTANVEPTGWIVTVEDVERGSASGHPRVIDARAADRFHGAPHPLDTASGHVPGARNRFYRENLGPDGRYKSAAALRAEYDALLAGEAPSDIAMQCGSGVTACHNLLAMEIAGLPGARLWPGSWSEWTSDPKRPVVLD